MFTLKVNTNGKPVLTLFAATTRALDNGIFTAQGLGRHLMGDSPEIHKAIHAAKEAAIAMEALQDALHALKPKE